MDHFYYRLIPPRPTFPGDMTDAEGAIMDEHVVYWSELIGERKAVVYGPVLDPLGVYGVAVVEVEDEATARAIASGDPAITSQSGFRFELHPMPDAKVRS